MKTIVLSSFPKVYVNCTGYFCHTIKIIILLSLFSVSTFSQQDPISSGEQIEPLSQLLRSNSFKTPFDIGVQGVYSESGLVDPIYSPNYDIPFTITWENVGGTGTTDGLILAIAVDASGNVYAGGNFLTIVGISANRIAKWNGSNWSALGSGLDGEVGAITIIGNDVYAAGSFNTAGGVTVNRIAKWNGSSWSALGTGLNFFATSLAASGGNLYVAGGFTTAGGITVNHIALWNGSSWSALGTGTNNNITTISVNGNNVYAGGIFTTAGGMSANYIAKWNGSSWSALGSGMNTFVNSIAVNGSDVYAGGNFTTAGGISASRIAKWNGSSWSALGSGLNNTVRSVQIISNIVFAGGNFNNAGGISAIRIAKWNGSSWAALGSGVNAELFAIYPNTTDGKIYVGGNFTNAGGITASKIARFNDSETPVGISQYQEIPGEFKLFNNYPNPFNPKTKIKFSLPHAGNIRLTVYDALGKEVIVLVNENLQAGIYETEFEAANIPSGVYFYRIETAVYTETKKMVVVK